MKKFKIVVPNKYNLTVWDIKHLKIVDESKISEPLFWRNSVVGAWCISKSIGTDADRQFSTDNEIWLGIYDRSYRGSRIHFRVSAYGGICNYNFKYFYNPSEIESELDFKTHEECLRILNHLLDEQILSK